MTRDGDWHGSSVGSGQLGIALCPSNRAGRLVRAALGDAGRPSRAVGPAPLPGMPGRFQFRGHGQLAARDIPVQRGQRLLLWRHLGLPFRSRDSDAVSPCFAVSGSHSQAARLVIQWPRCESEDSAFPPRYCAQHAWPVLLQAYICVSAAVP